MKPTEASKSQQELESSTLTTDTPSLEVALTANESNKEALNNQAIVVQDTEQNTPVVKKVRQALFGSAYDFYGSLFDDRNKSELSLYTDDLPIYYEIPLILASAIVHLITIPAYINTLSNGLLFMAHAIFDIIYDYAEQMLNDISLDFSTYLQQEEAFVATAIPIAQVLDSDIENSWAMTI